jgi:LmbE family N-acetylglucosaminyl deacetylase
LAIAAEPFDPTKRGTYEQVWRKELDGVPAWFPPQGPLLIVSPHPDDEILGAGGLMRMCSELGRRVVLVSVTDGEAAYPDWKELAQVRRAELCAAIEVLCGVSISQIRLGIADGQVQAATGRLADVIRSLVAPGTTIIAPYEHDGHPDHDATGRVCCEVANSLGMPIARYPIWTWHHADPATLRNNHWGKVMLDVGAQRAKTAAIQCFSSQLTPHRRTPIVPAHVVPYFTRPYEVFIL